MKNQIPSLALGGLLLSIFSPGCDDLGISPHLLPSIISFTAGPRNVSQGQAVQFKVIAASESELVRGVIDYRDGMKPDTVTLSGTTDSAQTSHTYGTAGIFRPTLRLENRAGHAVTAADSVFVRVNQLPQITTRLHGIEGSVSRAAKSILVFDAEHDPMTISITPLSAGLVFQMNAAGDSVTYYLTDGDENGSKQGIVTVMDQLNRVSEKVIDIVFDPRDDIRGRVLDRFEGTYLAGYRPAAVIQGPFTGWVTVGPGMETVKVPVDAGGRYAFPKLAPANHTIRAFITNGRDSSFIATYQIGPGDRTFDIGVETNAGTGMPLYRLLSLYQSVNFRTHPGGSGLIGSDLKNGASNYSYYLVGKSITTPWLNAKSFSPEQQSWLANEIRSRCFAHLPPGSRPRIVNGGPYDTLPVGEPASPYFDRTTCPYIGCTIVYANPVRWRNDLTIWELTYDVIYDYARMALDGGDAPTPPYGFSMSALAQMVGKTISGNGSMPDPYYNDKTLRAQNSVLDSPAIADMKLDWQVVFETPKFNNNVEAKYFGMPQ